MSQPLPKTRAFVWKKDHLLLLDQRLLPQKTVWRKCRRWQDAAVGISAMVVRGAPAIGCVAAYGIVLAARAKAFKTVAEMQKFLQTASEGMVQARPTAVNLRWAVEQMRQVWSKGSESPKALLSTLERTAIAIEEADRQANQRMGELGARLIPPSATVITHCNTGSLATAGLGTAFGVLWTAARQGKIQKVLATETRPYLQGARLTAWELKNERIPFELLTDSMAAHAMNSEKVHGVFVGADRIAANGDTANKIGTYSLAVLAAHHQVPFYVVAPFSSIDLSIATGKQIPIEQRSADEVTTIRGHRIAPTGINVRHPAFDVTPSELITGIVTERGIARAPFETSLADLSNRTKTAA